VEAILHDRGKKNDRQGEKRDVFGQPLYFFKIYKKTERSDSLLLVINKSVIDNVENEWQLEGRRKAAAERLRSSNKCFIHCPAEDKAETIIF
jgi:hypothetical protein